MTDYSPLRTRRAASRGWMITFADLLSLLLAFFVLLFAMSKVEIDAWKAMVDALSNRLNPLHQWTRPQLDTKDATPRLFAKRAIDLDYLAGVLQAKMADNEILSQGVLHRLEYGLVLSLPGDLIFSPGQTQLRHDSQRAMVALGATLKLFSNGIELVGHTDASPLPPNSPFSSNWDLSLARALALANALRSAGYANSIKVLGAANGAYHDISPRLASARRDMLARRIDLVIRESSAEGGANAP